MSVNASIANCDTRSTCIFLFQSSRDMLQTFSSKYLAGEGDIIKHLLHMGFAVTQTQVRSPMHV